MGGTQSGNGRILDSLSMPNDCLPSLTNPLLLLLYISTRVLESLEILGTLAGLESCFDMSVLFILMAVGFGCHWCKPGSIIVALHLLTYGPRFIGTYIPKICGSPILQRCAPLSLPPGRRWQAISPLC